VKGEGKGGGNFLEGGAKKGDMGGDAKKANGSRIKRRVGKRSEEI